jgi:TPP-dependent pyruvate/acetoin dehydrogenase alpha subunit
MSMMRELEDRIERKLYRQGKIVGGVYVGRGQEAIPVGTALLASALGPEDVLLPSHRDQAVFLIRGVPPGRILAQYMGRVGGLTRGRDGNMHMGDMKHGMVAIISALAATVPVAAGVAMALRYRGTNGVAFSYFGDGATSRGDWHEGVNFATVQKLPVVFICNNNQYAYSTPLGLQMACANVADRGPAYNMPAEIVDGNDVLAVHEPPAARSSTPAPAKGPYLLECKTFRMTGHSAHDAAHYVPQRPVRRVGQARPHRPPGSAHAREGWADTAEIEQNRALVRRKWTRRWPGPTRAPFPTPPRSSTTSTKASNHADHLSGSHPRRPVGGDGARPQRLPAGRGHRRLRRRVQGDRRLLEHFGEKRVVDTPISEAAIAGAAIGAGLMGLRPVAEMQFADFITCGFDQIVNFAAKCRYRWGAPCPSWCARPRAAAFTAVRFTRRIPKCGSCARPA